MRRSYTMLAVFVCFVISIFVFSGLAFAETPKLTVWLCSTFLKGMTDHYTKVFSEFAKSKGIDLEIQIIPDIDAPTKYAAAIEGGQPPDLAEFGASGMVRYTSHLVDLSELFAELGEKYGGYYPIAEQAVTFNGKQLGIPVGFQAQIWFLRKDKLEEKGLSMPTSWEELVSVAKELNDPDDEFYGFGQPLSLCNDTEQWIRSLLWAYGASEVKEDGLTINLNTLETIEALNFLKDMYESNIFPPDVFGWDGAGNNKAYLTGRSPIIQNAMSLFVQMKSDNPDLLENTVISPALKGPKNRVDYGAVFTYGVFKESKNKELAIEALRYLMDKSNYAPLIEVSQGYYIPTLIDYAEMPMFDDPYMRIIFEQINYSKLIGFPGPVTAQTQEVYDTHIIVDMVQRVLVDGVTPEDAIEEAVKRLERVYGR